MKKAFVTGFPIKHSKSPLLHGHWLKKYNVDGTYEAIEIDPKNFKDFLYGLKSDGLVGGNVTLPHKETAFELVEKRDEAAEIIGAVNTIWFEGDILCGGNTDGYGFSANLDDYAKEWRSGKTTIILGAGGASRAVIHSVLKAGFNRVHIVNRTLSRAETLADRFGDRCVANPWQALPELLNECDLLVNTTSLGMSGSDSSETPMPDLQCMKQSAIITDIVYTPIETPLLTAAKSQGLVTVDGLGMLLHQAVPGFEKWFSVRPEVTHELRQTILDAVS